MTKWQYLAVLLHQNEAQMGRLNEEFGDAGWEVCTILPVTERPGYYQWLMKRPKPAALELDTKDGKRGGPGGAV